MKRIFDFLVAFIVLIFISPLLMIAAILIFISMGSPVIFLQVRPGLRGVPFNMIKFRTMRNEYDSKGSQLPDGERLTFLGKIIRSSSLDELPSLWCVLKGDMSLVGPRPLLVEYLPLYSVEQARRHELKPGITGWAQVNGRNAITWEEKFKLDVWYVDNQSFYLDLRILLLTIKKVLLKEGISAEGHATVEFFKGSRND